MNICNTLWLSIASGAILLTKTISMVFTNWSKAEIKQIQISDEKQKLNYIMFMLKWLK